MELAFALGAMPLVVLDLHTWQLCFSACFVHVSSGKGGRVVPIVCRRNSNVGRGSTDIPYHKLIRSLCLVELVIAHACCHTAVALRASMLA